MSSAQGGYGGGGGGDNHHHLLLHHHGGGAGQLYHVPQHSRREKLRFPPDAADSPPQPAAWPPPAGFYSYASSSSSYSPHSPTLTQAQLVAHGLVSPMAPPPATAVATSQIPSQNFSLSLSSASSNPPPAAVAQPPRRQLGPAGGGWGAGQGPYGPFTGYAAVLGRSRFLGPAQKLLEEICDVGARASHVERGADGFLDADPMDAAAAGAGDDDDLDGAGRAAAEVGSACGTEQQWRKTKLLSMMEEVCKRYRQYYQQVQAVISSFEAVAGLSNAAPFASMALKTMAKHFRCLKGMIRSQLRNTSRMAVKEGLSKEDFASLGLVGGGACLQRANNVNAAFGHAHNIWRPQRGLPERAVSILRAWLFEHFLHPYPTDSDKQMLAKQAGLTRNQVSNWFINARVRLWKPMVEEIHNLEMRQQQKHSILDKNQRNVQQTQHSSDCSTGNPSDPSDSQPGHGSSITRSHNIPTSRNNIQDELSQMSNSMQGQVNFAYNGLSTHHNIPPPHHHQHVGGGVGVDIGGGNGGVSLTLGLHQNNRVCMPDPLPASLPPNLAHRFGLEDVNDAYVMGSFDGQDRHFGKEMGGHLLHDFVG